MEIINLCYDKNFITEGATNIDIRNLNSIPNFSAYKIIMSFLNKLPKQQSVDTINTLCNKLRKSGTLTFTLLDFDQLIRFYQDQKIELNDITTHTKAIDSFISRSEIIKMFHKHPHISIDSITYDEIYAVYTISRVDL